MVTREITKSHDFMSETGEQGTTKILNHYFNELISWGSTPTQNICKLFRHYLLSNLGLYYFSKLNLLAKNRLIGVTDESRDDICSWIDRDVMGTIDELCETTTLDNPSSLSAISDVIMTLISSHGSIEEEYLEDELDYVFDMPYQLAEMIKESPNIPWFYKHSWQYEEQELVKKVSVHISEQQFSLSYTMDLKW